MNRKQLNEDDNMQSSSPIECFNLNGFWQELFLNDIRTGNESRNIGCYQKLSFINNTKKKVLGFYQKCVFVTLTPTIQETC